MAFALLVTTVLGCSRGGTEAYKKYIPADEIAQKALEAALTDWKNGKPPGIVEGTKPPVQVHDSQRQPKQQLREFEVLGPGGTSEGPKTFNVKLVLENPHAELQVRYYVLGADPIMVYTQRDYEMLTDWDQHGSAADRSGGKSK